MIAQRRHELVRILIAGGAGGVGLACAEALAEFGADLILCDIDGIALTSAAERVGAFARFCDSIEDNSVAIFAAEIADRFGSIDVLINAAGDGYVRALAMMRMTRAFMPLLRRASGERLLINIAPAGGFDSSAAMFPYASSRVAFDGLCEALAEQVRGTSIEIVNVTPTLGRAAVAVDSRRNRVGGISQIREEYVAQRVVDLIGAARAPDQLHRRQGPGVSESR